MGKVVAIGIILLFIVTSAAFALRCGNEVINVGDSKNEALLKCGAPFSKETIGYIDHVESEERVQVMKIEEWIVEKASYGTTYYHSLIFEGNVLKEIKPAGEKK